MQHYKCKTSFFSSVQQEMEFQLGSKLPVKLCKIASLSYASRPKHSAVYYMLNSTFLNNAKPVSFVQQEIEFQLGSTLLVRSCKMASLSYS